LIPWFFHPSQQKSITSGADNACSQLQVRVATSADLTSISQIIAESFHSQNGIWAWTFPFLRLGIHEDLRHRLTSSAPHQVCLVAINTGITGTSKLVGTVELGVRFSDSWTKTGRSYPYLSNLAVHPKYRKQGIGSALLQACEQVVLDWGFQDLYLHVLETNHQARQLYFKQGYRVYKVESQCNLLIFQRSRQILLHKHLFTSLNEE